MNKTVITIVVVILVLIIVGVIVFIVHRKHNKENYGAVTTCRSRFGSGNSIGAKVGKMWCQLGMDDNNAVDNTFTIKQRLNRLWGRKPGTNELAINLSDNAPSVTKNTSTINANNRSLNGRISRVNSNINTRITNSINALANDITGVSDDIAGVTGAQQVVNQDIIDRLDNIDNRLNNINPVINTTIANRLEENAIFIDDRINNRFNEIETGISTRFMSIIRGVDRRTTGAETSMNDRITAIDNNVNIIQEQLDDHINPSLDDPAPMHPPRGWINYNNSLTNAMINQAEIVSNRLDEHNVGADHDAVYSRLGHGPPGHR